MLPAVAPAGASGRAASIATGYPTAAECVARLRVYGADVPREPPYTKRRDRGYLG
jgi:hypothetical protein